MTIDPLTGVQIGLMVAKKVHAKFSGAEVEQKEGGSERPGGSGRGSKWQQEFDKISAERRKREEEARKKWEEELAKINAELRGRDDRKYQEEYAKINEDREKQEREAREKFEEEVAKLG